MNEENEELWVEKEIGRYRPHQLELLRSFISAEDESALTPNLLIQGPSSSGKSFTLKEYLDDIDIAYSVVKCDECVNKRVLLQRCLKSIRRDSNTNLKNYIPYEESTRDSSFENLENFVIALESFIEQANYGRTRHVLILDKIDQFLGDPIDLYVGLSRLHEISTINNFCIIFVISSLEPKSLITTTIPRIYFGTYSQDEVVDILQANQLCEFPEDYFDSENEKRYTSDKQKEREFWGKYVKAIVDTLYSYTGANIELLMDICIKLWDKFIQPVIEERFLLHEFVKLYRHNQYLFREDEAVIDSLVSEDKEDESSAYDLPIYSKYLLISSYLASFNEPKHDLRIFTKLRDSKKRKISRKQSTKLSTRMLQPSFFEYERMLAILSSIYRNEGGSVNIFQNEDYEEDNDYIVSNTDIQSQFATLVSLKLVTKNNTDPLSGKTKWKCNLSWFLIKKIAEDIKFPITNYVLD